MEELTLLPPSGIFSSQSYFATSQEKSSYVTISLNETQVVEFVNGISEMRNYFGRCNDLQISAIRNLYKTKKLLQLDLQLAQASISEFDYSQEIEANPERYSIVLSDMASEDDIDIIKNIIHEVGMDEDISVDEISEIFSIETDSLKLVS